LKKKEKKEAKEQIWNVIDYFRVYSQSVKKNCGHKTERASHTTPHHTTPHQFTFCGVCMQAKPARES